MKRPADPDVLSDEPSLKPPTSPEPTPHAPAARHESPLPNSSFIGTSSSLWFSSVTGPPLYAQKGGLLFRRTVVIPLAYSHPNDPQPGPGFSSIDERPVAKMSWQHSNRLPEDTTVRLIRKKIPMHWRKHVTDLKCSVSLHADELGVPRKIMVDLVKEERQRGTGSERVAKLREALRVDRTQDRVFRVLVCSRYSPLNQAKDEEEFKTVFKDVVKVHYVKYKKTGILHRDLSVTNIMFFRRSDRVIGVLNDWDLAAPDVRSSSPTALHRTGTAAFTALHLLDSPYYGSVPHLYCYDLESFAWIMMWCSFIFCFDGGEVMFDKRPETVQTWTQGANWAAIRSSMTDFLTTQLPKLLKHVTTPMESLKACWIAPVIMNMMIKNLQRLVQCADGPIEVDFFEFEAFMKILEPEVELPGRVVWGDEDSTSTQVWLHCIELPVPLSP